MMRSPSSLIEWKVDNEQVGNKVEAHSESVSTLGFPHN